MRPATVSGRLLGRPSSLAAGLTVLVMLIAAPVAPLAAEAGYTDATNAREAFAFLPPLGSGETGKQVFDGSLTEQLTVEVCSATTDGCAAVQVAKR